MKKSIIKMVFSFFTTVVLCAQLVSCQRSGLPLTSDNFPKDFVNSFFENYRLVDPQLAYVTASPWEVEIKVDSDNKLYLSLIDNVDKAQFLSVTERRAFYMGAPSYSLFVYQTPDAPTPMKDWTIKSIRVIEMSPIAETKENALLFSEKFMDSLLESSTVLHTYDNDTGSAFLDMIKNAYLKAETFKLGTTSIKQVDKRTDYSQPSRFCLLLIEFNESNDIIWHSYLYEDSDNIYFECTTYTADDVDRKGLSLAKISDEYLAEMRELIEKPS